jgi:hypothetical protein
MYCDKRVQSQNFETTRRPSYGMDLFTTCGRWLQRRQRQRNVREIAGSGVLYAVAEMATSYKAIRKVVFCEVREKSYIQRGNSIAFIELMKTAVNRCIVMPQT